MFHDKMNGEKADDLKKLFGWVKNMKNSMIINCVKTGKTARNSISIQEYERHKHTMFPKKMLNT